MTLVPERSAGHGYKGLKNQGATCYLNTVLQCLYMTKDFRREVENFTRGPQMSDDESVDLIEELQKLFKNLKEVDSSGTTEGITRCLHINNVREQQDAVEYYQKTLRLIGPQMSKIFEGVMSNNTKCQNDHPFQEECPFFTIPLSIESESNFNVDKGLDSFFKQVKLDGDNLIYCDDCGEKAKAETWTKIEKFPTILTLYLKRFHFDYNQMKLVKNHCTIVIPLQLYNGKYELYAIINHIGERSGGHYNAVIRSFEDNEWYRFDDSTVKKEQVSNDSFQFRSKLAYLLMYRKKVDVPPPANDLQQLWQEYYELVTELQDWIRHHINVFGKRIFPTSRTHTRIFPTSSTTEVSVFHCFRNELREMMTHKTHSKHIYKNFECLEQAGRFKVQPGYHPTDVEKEWGQLCAAIQKWKQLYKNEFKCLVEQPVPIDIGVCKEQLNQAETLLQMDLGSDVFYPNTGENLTYPQLERCMTDRKTRLPFLVLKEKKQERKTSLSVYEDLRDHQTNYVLLCKGSRLIPIKVASKNTFFLQKK